MSKNKKLIQPEKKALSHNPFAALNAQRNKDDAPPSHTGASSTEVAAPTVQAPQTAIAWHAKVVVRRETKGRGGKTVTRISGLPRTLLPEFVTRMKRSLGCGALVEGDDLVLLGSLVERAATWLENEGAKNVVRGN